MDYQSHQSNSFGFLSEHGSLLASLPSLAEAYFHRDRNTCMLKVRQFGEVLTATLRAHHGLPTVRQESQKDLINRLARFGMIAEEVQKQLHLVRKYGNDANHEFLEEETAAAQCLRSAHYLALWFHQAVTGKTVEAPKYRLPQRPKNPNADFEQRLAQLADELRSAMAEQEAALEERDAALTLAEQVESALDEERARYTRALDDLTSRLDRVVAAESKLLARQGAVAARQLEAPTVFDRPGVWAEQREHLRHFVGRAEDFAQVRQLVRSSEARYVLLLGTPGQGKSAFMAKLAETIGRGGATRAGDAEDGQPVLLQMGKSGGEQRQILQFLLWQASTHLADPLPASDYTGSITDLRGRLLGALSQIVDRRGAVCVIIDGLDELVTNLEQPARDLIFLPDALPEGVTFVLATRPVDAIVGHLERRLASVRTHVLRPLSEEDVAAFLWERVDPPVFDWIQQGIGLSVVVERTGGVPLLLRRVADVASRVAASPDALLGGAMVPESLERVFEDQYRELRHPPGARIERGASLRETIAAVLALSSESLGYQEIARACRGVGVQATTGGVRDACGQMGAFVLDLGGGLMRLYHQGLADYVAHHIGADGRVSVHQALAGDAISSSAHAGARLHFHVEHALAAHREAAHAGMTQVVRRMAATVCTSLTNFTTVRTAVEAGYIHDVVDMLARAVMACSADLDAPLRDALSTYEAFVNQELAGLGNRPWLFYQQALSSPHEGVAAAAAAALPPARPYFRSVLGPHARQDDALIRRYPGTTGVWSSRLNAIQVATKADLAVVQRDDCENVGAWRVSTGEECWQRNFGLSLNDDQLAVSPRGTYVAVSTKTYVYPYDEDGNEIDGADPIGDEGGVSLLDGKTGETIWEVWPRWSGKVNALVFSPDEQSLFVGTGGDVREDEGDADGGIHVLALADGGIIQEVEGLSPVRALELLDDGGTLVSAGGWRPVQGRGGSGDLRLWDAMTLVPRRHATYDARVTSLACLPRRRIAMGDDAGRLREVDAELRTLHEVDSGLDSVTRLQWVHAARTLLVGEAGIYPRDTTRLQRWSVAPWRQEAEETHRNADVAAFALDAEGRHVLMAGMHGMVLRHLRPTRPVAGTLEGKSAASTTAKVLQHSKDLRRRLVRDAQGRTRVEDCQSGEQCGTWYSQEEREPAFSNTMARWWPAGANPQQETTRTITLGTRGTAVSTVDSILGGLLVILGVEAVDCSYRSAAILVRTAVESVSFSDDDTRVVLVTSPWESSNTEAEAAVIEQLRGVALKMADTPVESSVRAPTAAEDGRGPSSLEATVAGPGDGRVTVWDPVSGTVIASIVTEESGIRRVSVAPDGRHLAVETVTGVTVWRIADGERVLGVQSDPNDALRGGAFLFLSPEYALRDLTDDALFREFRPDSAFFSPNGGELLVCGSTRFHVRFTRRWSLDDYTEIRPSPCHHAGGFELGVDGRYAVYLDTGGLIVRDLVSGDEIAFWPETDARAYAVRDEGRIAVLGTADRLTVLELVEA